MGRKSELKAGVLLSYLNLAISTVIPLLYTPVMLRLLGQEEYGLYGLSSSVIGYLSLLTLGLGGAIVRYLMQYRASGEKEQFEGIASLFLLLYSCVAAVSLVAGLALRHFTGTLFGEGLTPAEVDRLNVLLVIMTINTAVTLVCSVFTSVIGCYERYIFLRTLSVASTIVLPIVNLAVLYAGYASIGMALVSLVLQTLLGGIHIWYCCSKLGLRFRLRNLPFGVLKEIFKYSAFVFIGLIADMLYWATDKVLLGAMMGSAAVAVYNVGGTFNHILQTMSASISDVFAPRVNTMVFQNASKEELSALLFRVGRIQYLIVSLVLSGFIVFGQSFLFFWAGEEYSQAYYVALLTMIPLGIPLIESIAFAIIRAANRHQFRSILYTVLAVANVVGTWLLIRPLGVIGAALCTCVVFVVGHGLCMNWFYYKHIGLDIPGFWKNILRMSAVPGAMILVGLVLNRLGVWSGSLLHLVIAIGVYTLLFCGLSWRFSMNGYEKELAMGLMKKVIRKRS